MADARRGRGRPAAGSSIDARAAILAAAGEEFRSAGYEGTSLRGVARRAGVDPALVHRYFGDKAALFSAAVDLAGLPRARLSDLLSGPRSELGHRIVRLALTEYEDPALRDQMVAVVRAAIGSAPMSHLATSFVSTEVVARFAEVAESAGGDDAGLRADLVSTQLFGLFTMRYVLAVEPLASAPIDAIVAAVGPTIQRYLFEELQGPPGA